MKHIPTKERRTVPEIEWRKIAGLRDIISHEYFGIDVDIIWDVICNKLDSLVAAVVKLRDTTTAS